MRDRRIRVVVVEDEFLVRLGLRVVINGEPDMTVVAEGETGHDGVRLYREQRPDLAVLNLRLPGLDGADATTAIMSESPQARVVILAGSEGSEDVYRAVHAGARAYLSKGIGGPELLKALREVHAGNRVIPAEIATRLAERVNRPDLTARERAVLELMVDGQANKEIALALKLSAGTVRTHVGKILSKLDVSDRTQAATAALCRGIVRRS